MKRDECLWCEGDRLVEGRLQSTGRIYFRPLETKFFVLADSNVNIQARVCSDCGYIDLYADTTKLKKLTKEKDA